MSGSISPEEIHYHKSQIESPDQVTIKRSLQRLCELMRGGKRPSLIDKVALEVIALGRLETMGSNAKIAKWCINLLGFVGTPKSSDAIVRVTSLHSTDANVVAAAIASLCAIHGTESSPWTKIQEVDPTVRSLALLQHLPADQVQGSDGLVNIERAPKAVLELGLILVGLGRAPESLFDPKHSNSAIVRVLGRHDDDVVKQYSVWAANENGSLGIAALGIPLKELASQPRNVRAWMYQLVLSCGPENAALISVLEQGSVDEDPNVRSGVARGIASRFVDGFEPIVKDWLPEEQSSECVRELERHVVCFSSQIALYRNLALDWFRNLPDNGAGRKNMFAAAKGSSLYGEMKREELAKNQDLFTLTGGPNVTIKNVNISNAGQVTIGGNAQNFGTIEVSNIQDGVAKLSGLLSELEAKIDSLGLVGEEKQKLERVVADAKAKPNKTSLRKLISVARKTNLILTGTVTSVEAWQTAFGPIVDVAEKLLALL